MIIRIQNTINTFFKHQSNSGIVILLSVVIAMVWANSRWHLSYHYFTYTEISIGIGKYMITEPVIHWVNDFLMAIFFLYVGLELKREILGGKLSTFKRAILPAGAALGGMLFPALIYMSLNWNTTAHQGWGIPMATDIAFALGVISLFSNRVPTSFKVFLVALAIVDDLGAVLVIALFYTSDISTIDLVYGLLLFLILIGGGYFGVRSPWFYAIIGIGGVWLAFFFSGIHPTTAGILTAIAIPGKVKLKEEGYLRKLQQLHLKFIESRPIKGSFISEEQLHILEEIKQTSDDAETPLQKIEHHLAPVVGFFILPLFALVNTGIHLHGSSVEILTHPISLGICLGLLVGKFIGIYGVSWLMIRFKIAELPRDMTWTSLAALSVIAGMGFTMSLFISELAFNQEDQIYIAKLSILFTSVIAALIGMGILYISIRKKH